MTNAPYQPPAGWYPDPAGSDGERFWDGVAWSQSTRDAAHVAEMAPETVEATAPAGYGRPMAVGDPAVAPFGRRVLGFFVDYIIVYFLGTLVLSLTGFQAWLAGELTGWLDALDGWAKAGGQASIPMPSQGVWTALRLASVISIAVYALYRTLLLGILSATVGQLTVGLRTVPVGQPVTSRIGWGAAIARGVVGAIFYQHLVIGFVNGIFAAFTSKNQTLSDMISKTHVLKTR